MALHRWRRHPGGAAPALVLLVASVVSFGSLLLAGVNWADEAWNLHLIDRMLRGDVLYHDFRYYPTPLAMFLGFGAAKAFGSQLLVLKALVAASFGMTAAANTAIIRMLSGGRRAQVLLVAGLLLFSLPPASSLYNTLAITFASLTALTVLRWDAALAEPSGRGRSGRLFRRAGLVGVWTGACVLTKYNVGAAVAVAVAGSFVVALFQRRVVLGQFVASALTAAGATLLTVLAGMTPVLLQGAGGDFVRQLLDGRSLLEAPVPYGEGWRRLMEGVRSPNAPDMRTFAAYLLLPLAGVVAISACARTREVVRGRLVILSLFSMAAAVVAVPRADHVVWAVPLPVCLLVAASMPLVRSWSRRRPVPATALRSLTIGFAVTWLALALVNEGLAARELQRVPAGHFEGALLPAGRWQEVAAEAAEIRARVGTDHKVFILSVEAGGLYLAADLRNPTRFDFPDAFEFGTDGVAEVKAALVNYTINFTCVSRSYPRDLEPARVIATVTAQSRLIAHLKACDLWRTGQEPPRRPASG